MNKPVILLVSELHNDFESNLFEIKNVLNKIDDTNFKMSYIYCYSLFEGALNQMAKTVCYAFPGRVVNSDVLNNISTKDLVELISDEDGIEEIVDIRIRKRSKNDLLEIIREYSKLLEISISGFSSFDEKLLIQISRERNNLVHAHTLAETNEYHNRPAYKYIKIDKAKEYIEALIKLMEDILKAVDAKYIDFTFNKLFLDSVEYTLGKCLNKPFYVINNDKYTLNLENCEYLSKALSGGERYVLGWWLYLYSDTIGATYGINILKKVSFLDEGTLAKIKYLKEFGRKFPFVLDGQHGIK